ncbi:hypothetical protein BS78_03G049200 [Paspalum vaginatum]|nr:hypothetical protein BS78_03G049200 [Paspalum vaginatum]
MHGVAMHRYILAALGCQINAAASTSSFAPVRLRLPYQDQEQEAAMSTTAHKVATQAATAGARGRRPPSVLREIAYGMGLGIFAGYLWKLHHWSNQRRAREFYSLLDQGKITVVAAEPPGGDD